MRFILVLLGFISTGLLVADDRIDLQATTDNPDVLELFGDLYRKWVAKGTMDGELAAFLVRSQSGEYRCLLWPQIARWRGESFRGVVPSGTIAVVHTHPHRIPEPSRGDLAEAKRSGLAIVVLTNSAINAAHPEEGRVLLKRRWLVKARTSGTLSCETDWFASNTQK